MTLSEELSWRGFVSQTTYSDLSVLDNNKITFYHGFDASADSQTVGNLAAMMIDKVFLRHGHQAIILAGGATSLIGDPGGKDKERQLQDEQTIAKNVASAEAQLKKIYHGYEFKLVNNLDWTKNMTVLQFLRDIGKHYSMTPLIQRDYIAQRIGEGGAGISYTEFSYTLLQGMDYLHLFDEYNCQLQIGGSDQWGNCLSGVELIRKARGAETHVITHPLVINKATGKKFGKSEAGAIWLDPNKTSPYKFYQFWLNSDDQGVEEYLKIYTELDKPTIEELVENHRQAPEQRLAQQRLAQEATQIVHGNQSFQDAKHLSEIVFGTSQSLNQSTAELAINELPTINTSDLDSLDIIQTIVELGLASSKSQARQFINDGAIKVGLNGRQLSIDSQLNSDDFDCNIAIIKRGKNSLGVIKHE